MKSLVRSLLAGRPAMVSLPPDRELELREELEIEHRVRRARIERRVREGIERDQREGR